MAVIANSANANELGVGATNRAARTELYDAAGNVISSADRASLAATQGGLIIAGRNDKSARLLRVDRTGGVAGADLVPLFHEDIEGPTFNTLRWNAVLTTMTATQSGSAGIQLNGGAITTINTNATIQTRKRFHKLLRTPLQFRMRARVVPQTNSVAELGFGDQTGATAHGNGAYWQWTTAGVCQPVVTFNGVDTSGTNIAPSLNSARHYIWDVIVDDDWVTFVCQDPTDGSIVSEQQLAIPGTQPKLWAASHIPAMARVFIAGVAPSAAPLVMVTEAYVGLLDALALTKPWAHTMAQLVRGVNAHPTTFAQTQQFSNSAEPGNASLSNTVAGYTTLGGKFQFVAPAGAVTDFTLFSFNVPTPYQLVVNAITIDAWNLGAAVATTPHLLTWGVGVQGASANLSSGAHIRSVIGSQSFPVGAAIGANVARLEARYLTPLVCDATREITIILRIPVGTATASQVIAGMVSIDGHFE